LIAQEPYRSRIKGSKTLQLSEKTSAELDVNLYFEMKPSNEADE